MLLDRLHVLALAGGLLQGPVSAQTAELRVNSAVPSISPGASIPLDVALATRDVQVSAIQFTLTLDNTLFRMLPSTGSGTRISGRSVHLADAGSGQKRFLIAALNRTVLSDGVAVRIFVNVDRATPAGVYRLEFSQMVASDPAGEPVPLTAADATISVSGSVDNGLPIAPQGVLNGASLLPGAIAPGEIVTLIGSGIGPVNSVDGVDSDGTRGANDVEVQFSGIRATVLYADPNQINAIAPYTLTPATSATISARVGERQVGVEVDVLEASPALFTQDASGAGQAVALNQDGSSNSVGNQALRGSIVSLFVTGLGKVDLSDGGIRAIQAGAIVVEMRGVSAEVLNAGVSPGMNEGVTQINCRVPDVEPGYAVPVVLQVGSNRSPAGVSISVE